MERKEPWDSLMEAFGSFDAEDTMLVALHGLGGRPLEDVAHQLGLPREAASVRWQHVLERLRQSGSDATEN